MAHVFKAGRDGEVGGMMEGCGWTLVGRAAGGKGRGDMGDWRVDVRGVWMSWVKCISSESEKIARVVRIVDGCFGFL